MSSLVRDHKSFLELLLQTSPAQRKLLLSSVTKPQLQVLGGIYSPGYWDLTELKISL